MMNIQPDNADEWRNLGVKLCKQGRHSKAKQAFRKAIEIRPDIA
ncbi:MAG: tetratricopeptide repeat protein [Candidatus Thorarchaeota archaeon]|nr:tetratricopeptide repeat protein [Candidatus Thorarchaeota archaeon]